MNQRLRRFLKAPLLFSATDRDPTAADTARREERVDYEVRQWPNEAVADRRTNVPFFTGLSEPVCSIFRFVPVSRSAIPTLWDLRSLSCEDEPSAILIDEADRERRATYALPF